MPFTCSKFRVETDDGLHFTLLEPVVYFTHELERIEIPAGATSDGASVPRALWNILPPFGSYWRAAVLHDWLYRCSTKPKDECDLIFRDAMTDLGVEPAVRDAIYEGVRLGGQAAFDEDRKAKA